MIIPIFAPRQSRAHMMMSTTPFRIPSVWLCATFCLLLNPALLAVTEGTPPAPVAIRIINTSTNLQATPTSAVTGQAVVLTARVAGGSGVPSGSVSFYDGAATIGAAPLDVNGKAVITASGMTNGSHLLTAQYTGSSVYAVSTSQPLQVNVAENATGEQARAAGTFVDSIGVPTHLAYTNTPYFPHCPPILRALHPLRVP